jgi:hypothetical protein
MKIFEPLMLKFEDPKWINDPELGLIDTVLEEHPELIKMLAPDITVGQKEGNFGRQDGLFDIREAYGYNRKGEEGGTIGAQGTDKRREETYNVIQTFQQLIEKESLHGKINFNSSFCMKQCQHPEGCGYRRRGSTSCDASKR